MYCQCTSTGPLTWTDFKQTALWRSFQWTQATWLAWEDRSPLSLLGLPGCGYWTICYDYMHVKYLGTDMYMFGSVLAVLTTLVMTKSEEENLREAWIYLKNYFKTHKTPSPFRYLNKLSMFVRQGKFPKLRGKASEVRHLGAALHELWVDKMNHGITVHRQIALMLKLNVGMEKLLTDFKDEFALPAGPAADFDNYCTDMLLLQSQVAQHFLEEGYQFFDITSKSHMLQHLGMMSRYLSPRLIWAFMGEDQMQRLQRVAKNCTRGNGVAQQNIKVAKHYRLGLHFLFEDISDLS